MMGTHTYVELEVSATTFNEVWKALSEAGYQHAFMNELTIDMQGIALVLKIPDDL